MPETLPYTFLGRGEIVASIDQAALLNRTATLADVGKVATFVTSDLARTVTEINISCGVLYGLAGCLRKGDGSSTSSRWWGACCCVAWCGPSSPVTSCAK